MYYTVVLRKGVQYMQKGHNAEVVQTALPDKKIRTNLLIPLDKPVNSW
jgi:hypothetical protein